MMDSFNLGDWVRVYETLNDDGHLSEEGIKELKRLKKRTK